MATQLQTQEITPANGRNEMRGVACAALVILLAWAGETPVGIAVCFRGFSTFAARPNLNLHDVAVRPDHRGRGVGRGLLQAVEARARALGCCKLTLEVLTGNGPALQAYTRFGFKPYTLDPALGDAIFLTKNLE